MFLKHLSLLNFKNYESQELSFNSKITALSGLNGQGKTNLLEAIYYLCFGKGFFSSSDSLNIRKGEEFFMIQGTFEEDQLLFKIHLGLKKGQSKVLKYNDKEYERLAQHIGLIPLVSIHPNDTQLLHDGSEERRRLMDSTISQYDSQYLLNLQNYNRYLKQRNALLKSLRQGGNLDPDICSVYNEQLKASGSYIFQARKSMLAELVPFFAKTYEQLSGQNEQVSLEYSSPLLFTDWDMGFQQSQGKDKALLFTTFGIHKDDLQCLLDGETLKRFGSQGQQKTYVLALKLAQHQLLKSKIGKTPILLLDDVFDKIDEQRLKRLVELILSDSFGQTFISDTDPDRLKKALNQDMAMCSVLQVQNGQVSYFD